jgi:hypothetical protein
LLFVSFGCFLVVTAFAATPSLSHPVSPWVLNDLRGNYALVLRVVVSSTLEFCCWYTHFEYAVLPHSFSCLSSPLLPKAINYHSFILLLFVKLTWLAKKVSRLNTASVNSSHKWEQCREAQLLN